MPASLLALGRQTFVSLSVRNYRLYFTGRVFSLIGNWMQVVALGWLVLQITGSGTLLGVVLAFRYFPMLALGPVGGSVVDRFEKRNLLYVTQTLLALSSVVLSAITMTGIVELWMLYALAFSIGLIGAIDHPTRQVFTHEMVGREHLRNAVSLNSTAANLSRVIGPAIAGVVIASLGIALCFLVNALSFLVLLVALYLMRSSELHAERRDERVARDWYAIIPYLRTAHTLRGLLIAMAIIGTLSYEFAVSLPLLAQGTFFGDAADYAALLSAMGVGAVAGGLFSASRTKIAVHEFALWAFLFGVALCTTAVMPSLGLAIVGMVFVGFFMINTTSTANTILQLESAPEMRGRVMALWSMAIFGSTLIGAPLIGFIGEHVDPRAGLIVGGAAAMLVALYTGAHALGRERILAIPSWFYTRRQNPPVASTKL